MFNPTRPLRYFFCVVFVTPLSGCTESVVEPPVSAITSTASPEGVSADASDLIISNAQANASGSNDGLQGDNPAAGLHVVRREATDSIPAEMPGVWLSTEHSALCRVRVGDAFPEITLPNLDGEETKVTDRMGEHATVVLFWQPDRWMTRTALSDLVRDVVAKYDSDQVSVLGIAVKQSAEDVKKLTEETEADFPQLLDADGKAFDKLGMVALPRIYVLDSAGTIVWFDIEYSESTRRELGDALAVLTAVE